ncbi:glycosyltransferase family 2 protein [Streptococcus oricebi]|uniref:Glycosyltransferase family 2 protein n=1 Tax=Streptococcus oricebi TaxID=1547447 RepID=A0ABS5B1W7_9STRE|nr:glycosyltransferase family 2 protein [Streptococcus oricebi]MBP2622488.1 glycosyltransferase family 2 protein [Streptococcus oricebi]
MKVNILMSTYNGERFLAEQLESIQQQTFPDWKLLIRDDGSSDRTLEIIEQFVDKDSRIRFINEAEEGNLGVVKSFHRLLDFEAADYYFFSDQDDVWLPDKVAMQLEAAAEYKVEQPLLIYTDLKVVDQDLNVVHESMIRAQSGHANTELLQELTENTVTGGVSMINHSLAQLWTGQETYPILMHDWYLALLATSFGQLVYLDQPGELYRQHDSNVLGARTLSKRLHNWLRPHLLFTKYWNLISRSQVQAKNLLALPLAAEKRDLIENFVTIMELPFKERYRRLRHYGYRKNRAFHTLVFSLLILTKFAYKEKK